MALIAPNDPLPTPKAKADKTALASALAVRLNETFEDNTGTVRTVAQGLAERLIHIGLFGDDKDAVSAMKVVFDRTLGKAPIQKDEHKVEMPQMVIALRESEIDKLNEKLSADGDGEALIGVKTESGEEFLL